ncbi:hypothetical protein D3C79_639370 [compost metagenome]
MYLLALIDELIGAPEQVQWADLAPARQADGIPLLLLDEVAAEVSLQPAQPEALQQLPIGPLAPQAEQLIQQRLQYAATDQFEGVAGEQLL